MGRVPVRVGDVVPIRKTWGRSSKGWTNFCARCSHFLPIFGPLRCQHCKATYEEFSDGYAEVISLGA